EQAVYAEIDRLKTTDVPAEELQKVKNNFATAEYRRLSSNFPVLIQLIQSDGRGNWREVNESGLKIQAVTAADVRRVANRYFTKENRAVAIYTRKAGAAGGADDPDAEAGRRVAPGRLLAGLDPVASREADVSAARLRAAVRRRVSGQARERSDRVRRAGPGASARQHRRLRARRAVSGPGRKG